MSGKVSGPQDRSAPVSGKVSAPPPCKNLPVRSRPLTTIAIPGLNGGRVGVEVGGEGVRRLDGAGLGGRGSEVGSREGVGPHVPTK